MAAKSKQAIEASTECLGTELTRTVHVTAAHWTIFAEWAVVHAKYIKLAWV